MTRYGERHAVLATTGDSFILSHIWHIRIYTFFHLNSFLLFVILVFLLGIILEHFIYIFVWNIRFEELSFSGGSYRGVQKLQMCWNSVMIFSILSQITNLKKHPSEILLETKSNLQVILPIPLNLNFQTLPKSDYQIYKINQKYILPENEIFIIIFM